MNDLIAQFTTTRGVWYVYRQELVALGPPRQPPGTTSTDKLVRDLYLAGNFLLQVTDEPKNLEAFGV